MTLKETIEKFVEAEKELTEKLQLVFPRGKQLEFKYKTMRDYQKATVQYAGVSLGVPEVYLLNHKTGGTRGVPLSAIPEKYWEREGYTIRFETDLNASMVVIIYEESEREAIKTLKKEYPTAFNIEVGENE